MADLVIVSNRLPLNIRKINGRLVFSQSMGGLATGLASYTNRPGTKWIGWPGIACEDLTTTEKATITKRLKQHRCYPVFLTQKQLNAYYNGYSNSVLWPALHELSFEDYPKRYWQAYQRVNRLFADETLRLSKPGSTIWVHDYQLMLVPEMLRAAARQDTIGFFHHTPFPHNTALLRVHEARNLTEGLLGASLIGFHTVSYSQHFLEACDILLGADSYRDFVQIGNRTVRVMEFPIGIDYQRFAKDARRKPSRQAVRKLRKHYGKQKIILTVDRLDPSKGLLERVSTYRQLLRHNKGLHGKVVMIMIVAPSRTDVRSYQTLKLELEALVANVTADFATRDWQPIDFIYRAVPLEEVMKYYQIADVAFIAPLRDGMNLVAKEFLASKTRNNGVLILSKTTGAAKELRDAIQVDPTKPRSLIYGLKRALAFPNSELHDRTKHMRQHIKQFNVQRWAATFINTLQQPIHVHPAVHPLTEGHSASLAAAYNRANKRLLLLDYDGVLHEFVTDPAAAVPTKEVMSMLRRLSNNPANDIVIISGRSKQNLDAWFGKLHVALAAEHGAFFRRAGSKNWHRTSTTTLRWQKPVKTLFDAYARITPGALVEQKNTGIAWHYRATEPYDSQKNLVAIRRLLKPLLNQFNLVIQEGSKVLEVHPAAINKGRIAQEWLLQDYDFVLAMGDDQTDEDTFSAMPAGAYSIKVGRGQTAARFRLKGVSEALALLGKF